MNRLSSKLLAWYHANKRSLPWRGHPSAYAVWVSEIMLQQTRVEAVIPYFEKWMRLFPTVQALADASEHDVLNAWEGLGYYSRARNLHKAAKIVADLYEGEMPRDLDQLRKLPGIGRYTLGGYCLDRVWYGCRRAGWKYQARLCAHLRSGGARRLSSRRKNPLGAGGEEFAERTRRRLQSGADGPRGNHLHTEESALLNLPGDEIM